MCLCVLENTAVLREILCTDGSFSEFLPEKAISSQEHQNVPSQTGPIYYHYVEAAVHSGEEGYFAKNDPS